MEYLVHSMRRQYIVDEYFRGDIWGESLKTKTGNFGLTSLLKRFVKEVRNRPRNKTSVKPSS
jgi:hypothetical protein